MWSLRDNLPGKGHYSWIKKLKMTTTDPSSSKPVFSTYQKLVVAMLAFLQFAVILDFMLMSPLGATIMPSMAISAKQFGLVVSAYAFSAGLSGLLTAGFADRYDRKKLLLFFYYWFHTWLPSGAGWRRAMKHCCWRVLSRACLVA